MGKEMISVELTRETGSHPWGFRLGGGVDRGRVHVLEKVSYYILITDWMLSDSQHSTRVVLQKKIDGKLLDSMTYRKLMSSVFRRIIDDIGPL